MSDTKKTFDVEETLRLLAEAERMIDSTLTAAEREAVTARHRRMETRRAEEIYAAGAHVHASEDFDLLATADALESLAAKVRAVVELKEATLHEKVLDVYHAIA